MNQSIDEVQKILIRAASISNCVDSITLGPNSSYRNTDDSSGEENSLILNKISDPVTKSKSCNASKSKSIITPEDMWILRDNYFQNVEKRRIEVKVRKQMASRLQSENDHIDKVQQLLEKMRIETAKLQEEKEEALQMRIKEALKQEEQEEIEYQKHCSELAEYTRKILKQQENELNEILKKSLERFTRLETNFNKIIQICQPEMSSTIEEYKKKLNILKQKKGTKSPNELSSICNSLEEYCKALIKMRDEVEEQIKKNKIAEENAKRLAEENARLEQQKIVQEKAAQAAAADALKTEFQNPLSKYQELLKDFQHKTRQLSEQPELQSIRFALKMAVNKPINLLDREDKKTLNNAYQSLQSLLSGQNIETTKGTISVNVHPQALLWTKMRIAEKLISNMESKYDYLFIYASLIISLWQDNSDFGKIFLSLLYKECPFLYPYVPKKLSGQSDDDFLNSLGYRVDEKTKKLEMFEVYQARTANYMGLLAGIWVTSCRQSSNQPHPLSIDNAWYYLVNVLNASPNSLYINLVDKMLEISGSSLHMTYGKQFIKLIKILNNSYLPSLSQKIDEKMRGSYDRLSNMTLNNFAREQRFPEPKGKLPSNYW